MGKFQRAPQGWSLCGLGTAATVFRRSSGGLQIAARVIDAVKQSFVADGDITPVRERLRDDADIVQLAPS